MSMVRIAEAVSRSPGIQTGSLHQNVMKRVGDTDSPHDIIYFISLGCIRKETARDNSMINFINNDYQQLRITVQHVISDTQLTIFNCLKLLHLNTFFNVSDNCNNDDF
jgi:hypothetical protein